MLVGNIVAGRGVNVERLAHELLTRASTERSRRAASVSPVAGSTVASGYQPNFGSVHTATKVLAVVPARSGSKSVPHKNIRLLAGKPMLAYSIQHAQEAALVDRVLVSTDSEQYRDIAIQHGAEAPFLRPSHAAQDASPDLPLFQHALEWLKEKEGYVPDIVVHLRPTCPIRRVADIDTAVALLVNDTRLTAVRSVSASRDNPWRMWWSEAAPGGVGAGAQMRPVAIPPGNEVYPHYTTGLAGNTPRQLTPVTYSQNSCIDVVRASELMRPEGPSMTGERVYGLVTEAMLDIDTEEDFKEALAKVSG